jgi:hypothetical protein
MVDSLEVALSFVADILEEALRLSCDDLKLHFPLLMLSFALLKGSQGCFLVGVSMEIGCWIFSSSCFKVWYGEGHFLYLLSRFIHTCLTTFL